MRDPDAAAPPANDLRRACMLLAILLLSGCESRSVTQARTALADCRLPRLVTAAKCAIIELPARADAPTAHVGVTVLPANTLSPKPDPLFMIAGGPGQLASALLPLTTQLGGVRRTRDIVLVDPRGSGRSEALSCAALKSRDAFDGLSEDDISRTVVQACLDELRSRGVDLGQFTTEVLVGDLDAVRAALGYERINLWGGSYGTRVVQQYVRRHEDRVRSIVLDGVAVPGMRVPLDIWVTRDEALRSTLAACANDAACRASYPDPVSMLPRLRSALAKPRRIDVEDPRTGVARPVSVTYDLVLSSAEALLYVPELSSLVPTLLARAEAGDFAPLLAATTSLGEELSETFSLPLHYAVICAEDAPRVRPDEVAAVTARLLAPDLAARNIEACSGWPAAKLAADFTQPLNSNVPALILSGGLDPVTPPANGATVAKTLPNSTHVIAAAYGHIVSPHACAPRLIATFLEDAAGARLDAACIDYFAHGKRPPLYSSVLEAR